MIFLLGDTWRPNITVERATDVNGKGTLYVAFAPVENVEKYHVFLMCNRDIEMKTLYNVRHVICLSI